EAGGRHHLVGVEQVRLAGAQVLDGDGDLALVGLRQGRQPALQRFATKAHRAQGKEPEGGQTAPQGLRHWGFSVVRVTRFAATRLYFRLTRSPEVRAASPSPPVSGLNENEVALRCASRRNETSRRVLLPELVEEAFAVGGHVPGVRPEAQIDAPPVVR